MARDTKVIYVTPSPIEREKFDALCNYYRRTVKDMVLWLVEREHERVFGPQSEHSTTPPQTGI